MENKINIAELLKDCPKGMELDCTMYDNLEFDYIDENSKFPIRCRSKITNVGYNSHDFTEYGEHDYHSNAKCVIFPKGKTSWEGFHRPFEDGDILATDLGSVFYLNIRLNTYEYYGCYVGIGCDGSFHICEPFAYKECCGFATEEEKAKLFDAIKANGYKWNAETKTLENLVPDKFDITTLKPFDKVLVRDRNTDKWEPNFWGFYNVGNVKKYPYECCGNSFAQCIPYEGNEHLLSTTNDCGDFYKTWEK